MLLAFLFYGDGLDLVYKTVPSEEGTSDHANVTVQRDVVSHLIGGHRTPTQKRDLTKIND
jgi:hypothetical protein